MAVTTVLLSLQTWHNFKLQWVQPLVAAGGAVEQYDNQQELGVRGGITTSHGRQGPALGQQQPPMSMTPSEVQVAQTPSVAVIGHRLRLLIGRPCLHGWRARCEGVIRRRVMGFGRAGSSLSSSTAAMTTKARDDGSEDGAWDDPRRCRIRCHVGRRTIEATEEAEDNAIPPLAAATGEE